MADSLPPTTDRTTARRGPRKKSVVVSAGLTVVVACVGIAVALTSRSGSSPGPKLSTTAQLEASAKAVAARHPEMKADLEPLSADELANATTPGYAVVGLWVLDPVGISTSDRPTVRWIRFAGAKTYEVQIEADGRKLFAEATADDHVAFPARLEPLVVGTRYVVHVRVADPKPPQGEVLGFGEFTVLPVPRRAAWRTIVGDVESNEPAAIRDLLVAHWAIRRQLFGEALRRADAWSTAHPGDPAARPLLGALGRIYELGPAPAPWAGFARR
jgi:hypothetical protein